MTPTEVLIAYLEGRGLTQHEIVFREALHTLAQAIMECDVGQALDARLYERNGARRAYRNGYRDSVWYSSIGPIPLRIPRLRKGSYCPRFLDKQAEAGLLQLVQDAFVMGIAFDDVVAALAALNLSPMQPYEVADITERLADVIHNARHEPFDPDYPVLFLDVLDVEQDGRWRQLMIVLGIDSSGSVSLLTHDLVSTADNDAWARLLERLRQRGLREVEVVVSEDAPGVRVAVNNQLADAVWQHHRNFLLRGSGDDDVVRAVSDLAVRVETDATRLPRMQLQWPVYTDEFDFAPTDTRLIVIG